MYAKYLFKDRYAVKEVTEAPFVKAEKVGAWCLRIGKNVEAGAPEARAALLKTLGHCVTHNIRPIVVSKLLEFDKQVADLIIQGKGILHISIGDDSDETGAVARGATNKNRLAQALRYKKYGCPVQVRIVADVTQKTNKFHREIFSKMGSKGCLVTPLHHTSKAHFAKHNPTITWEQAKASGKYYYGHGDLRPAYFHPDWRMFKEVCGTSYKLTPNGAKETEHCNNCGLGNFPFNKQTYKEKFI